MHIYDVDKALYFNCEIHGPCLRESGHIGYEVNETLYMNCGTHDHRTRGSGGGGGGKMNLPTL